ncbi:MAG: AMIN domain-containing protein, partial [Pseudohongiellaceae bacterium]
MYSTDIKNEEKRNARSNAMMRLSQPRILMLQTLLGLLILCAHPARSQVIEDIQFSSLPGDRFQIELVFDSAPPEAEIFEIENPARLSLDFVNVGSGLADRRFPLEFRNANSVVVLESGGRTRMVVNLVTPASYTTSISGNRYLLVMGSSADAGNV